MPVCLVEEQLEYEVEGTIFYFERLRHDDREKITYLSVQRGTLDQQLYDKICLSVALKGWKHLYGQNGEIPWPFRAAEGMEHPLTPEQLTAVETLFPRLTPEIREQLNGAFYVVSHLPLNVTLELSTRINELAPESVKKKWPHWSDANSSSLTDAPATNLPVMTVGGNGPATASPSPVTGEG